MNWVKRVKWGNVIELLVYIAIGVLIGVLTYNPAHFKPTTIGSTSGIVKYSYRIQAGDTIWDVASNVATPNEDVRKIMYKIIEDNKIQDAQKLEPGSLIYINLERVK